MTDVIAEVAADLSDITPVEGTDVRAEAPGSSVEGRSTGAASSVGVTFSSEPIPSVILPLRNGMAPTIPGKRKGGFTPEARAKRRVGSYTLFEREEIIALRFVNGMSPSAIAESLNLTHGTVLSGLRRPRVKQRIEELRKQREFEEMGPHRALARLSMKAITRMEKAIDGDPNAALNDTELKLCLGVLDRTGFNGKGGASRPPSSLTFGALTGGANAYADEPTVYRPDGSIDVDATLRQRLVTDVDASQGGIPELREKPVILPEHQPDTSGGTDAGASGSVLPGGLFRETVVPDPSLFGG